MKHYLVSYDIQCNRLRQHIAKTLERLGERVQYSVFELYVSNDKHIADIFESISPKLKQGDSLRFYYLHPQTQHRNLSNQPQEAKVPIIVW